MERPANPGEANRNTAGQIRQGQVLKGLHKASLAVHQARTPDDVYNAVVEEMGSLGYHTLVLESSYDGKDLCIARMVAPAESQARVHQLAGWPSDPIRIPLSALAGYEPVLEHHEAIFVADTVPLVRMILPEPVRPMAERMAAALSLEQSILAPLDEAGSVKGLVLISAHELTAADLPAVTAFARQISAALERARLFAELQEREWRSTIAYEVAQQYAQELKDMVHEEQQRRSELDRLNVALRSFADRLQHSPDESAIARLLCQTVHDTMGWQQATVLLQDAKTVTWRFVAQVGHRPQALQMPVPPWLAPPADAPWQREEFRVSHSYYVRDAPIVFGLDPAEALAPGMGPSRDLLVVFLEAGGETLGMLLSANRADGQPSTRQQVEHLELFAVQAAIAIESTRLSRSVQMWADAVRYSGDAIFIADVEGRILNANPAFESLTGLDRVKSPGEAALTLQSRLSPPNAYEEMWNSVQAGHSWRGEVTALKMDGSAYDADLTVAPIVGGAGEIIGFVGSQRDITPIRELDRLKSKFVANVSHELRTPLTNIKLYQRYLRQDRRPNMRDRFFEILEAETQRLEQIIESLLDLSRLETGIRAVRSEAVDLNDLARTVLAEHQPEARARGISLYFQPSPGQARVMADRQHMAAVLGNLLANALSFTPEEGNIKVMTQQDRDVVLLSVQDSGCGIAPEEIDHVFERFYRGQAAESLGIAGAGLGLSIVKQILELHRGTIEVNSQVGRGTTLTLTLPAAGPPSGTSPAIVLRADDRPLSR